MAKKSVVITAKRWFQKSYGNTYHSVKVTLNGKVIGREVMKYGYGEQYMQTAEDIVKKNSKVLQGKPIFTNWKTYLREKGYNIEINISDVSTQREVKSI